MVFKDKLTLSDTHQPCGPPSLCELIAGGVELHRANLTPGLNGLCDSGGGRVGM